MAEDKTPKIYPELNLSIEERNVLAKVAEIPTRDMLAKQFHESRIAYLADLRKRRAEFRMVKSQKEAGSVYGLGGRFPTTLYREQWEILFEHIEEIKTFVKTLPTGKWKVAS
jgi:hypothetical protein